MEEESVINWEYHTVKKLQRILQGTSIGSCYLRFNLTLKLVSVLEMEFKFSILLFLSVICWVKAFFSFLQPSYSYSYGKIKIKPSQSIVQCRSSSPSSLLMKKATMDGDTLWRISAKLRKSGTKSSDIVLRVRFVPDRNYEPPQGRIFIEDDFNGLVQVDDKGYSGVWTLSEDKEDRKDGLWIWGLFEEPKYPFLYFYMDVYNTTILPSGEEAPIFNGEGIPNNRLNFRFDHLNEKNLGTVLKGGLMNYKESEYIKADPFGVGGKVDVGDSIPAGEVDIRAVTETEGGPNTTTNTNT